jgi:hypothetical protein
VPAEAAEEAFTTTVYDPGKRRKTSDLSFEPTERGNAPARTVSAATVASWSGVVDHPTPWMDVPGGVYSPGIEVNEEVRPTRE